MDEKRYHDLAHHAFGRILDAFDTIDTDDADAETTGDVITITWRDGTRCIVNTQRPARQIWLAGGGRAWHFSYDEGAARWMDDRDSGVDLEQALIDIADGHGVELRIAR